MDGGGGGWATCFLTGCTLTFSRDRNVDRDVGSVQGRDIGSCIDSNENASHDDEDGSGTLPQ